METSPRRRSGVTRLFWAAIGLMFVGLGSIGVVVPGLPSTVFFLVAAWCFARSSERLERWLLELPGVGPLVRDARAGLGMPRRTKATAIVMMWTAIGVSAVLLSGRPVLAVVMLALGAIGTACILLVVPTRELVLAERAAFDSPADG
ncbi:MAG TPA: YbaN family protein [Ilumatobacteraceae bacterium]|nr:YbaN family protein [Ilumatobacteraceae bacterium]